MVTSRLTRFRQRISAPNLCTVVKNETSDYCVFCSGRNEYIWTILFSPLVFRFHWQIQERGTRRCAPPLGLIFFSISCCFWQKMAKVIGWHPTFSVYIPVWEILDQPLVSACRTYINRRFFRNSANLSK